ncbi:D-alanyl-D-alanine carboxypeptidase [Halobacteriovorax sp. RT-2-4]|uniref:D-alanyl-D-alanine carboxypeptidase n=1 Tax=unclassified Halobacteriovorax TaxID=2639665 RepID=UPI003999F5DD
MKFLVLIFFSLASLATTSIDNLKKEFLDKGDELSYFLQWDSGKSRSLDSKNSFIPASIFKIFSAYYILDKLGTDYRFKTSIASRGHISNGTLKGDLILSTSGDPYFLTAQAYDLIDAVKAAGIKKVEGKLIVVNNFVDLNRIGNVGLDDQPYNQSISGLNINFNRFKSIGRDDKNIFPTHNGLEIKKSPKPLGPGEVFRHIKNNEKESWVYTNSKDYFLEVPIRDSLQFNANYFNHHLKIAGIETKGVAFEESFTKSKILNTVYSVPSLDMVKLSLEYSNNLFIETLVLKATKKDNLKDAAQKMVSDLKLPVKGELTNSSGLSVNIEMLAQDIVNFINKNAYKKFGNNYFINLLSITGHSGSLHRKYLTNKGFEKYRYKTGSLDFVYNICGRSFEADPVTFCVMINNPKKRQLLMGPNSAKNEKLRQEAKAWRRSKERFSELLMYELN